MLEMRQNKTKIKEWFTDAEHICVSVLILGFLFRIIYVIQVRYDYSPHDLGKLIENGTSSIWGHLTYIQYIYLHKGLPDSAGGQYYQPPLFHIIGAVALALSHIKENYEPGFENLQVVNMLFASIGIFYGYRILKKIGKKDTFLIAGTAFLSFCPAFYIIGAELNNDCLMTMFQIMALYYTICWSETQKLCDILKIALCIGFSMLTKTNGGLIAISVGSVFIYKFLKNYREWKKYIIQFFCFGIVCIPMGLCWNVYRFLRYGLPLTYVLKQAKESPQYIGDISWKIRLGLPSPEQLFSNSIDWGKQKEFSNIWGQTFLTMNFDEGILEVTGNIGNILAVVLLWVSMILSICFFVLLIRCVFSSEENPVLKMLFPVNFFVVLWNYVIFAFRYPHICTMNFRYIVIVQILLISSALICHKNKLINRYIEIGIYGGIILQSILTVYVYLVFAV